VLAEPAGNREKWLQDHADRKLTDTVKKAVAAAATVEDLHSALLPVIDLAATPDLVSKGAMVLQPSEERRRRVDRNPMAVNLAKLSLWLVTLAKDHAFTFMDHALRHGDSLVGLSRKQIEALYWDSGSPILKGLEVHEPLEKVAALRKRIREADGSVSDWELRNLWDQAHRCWPRCGFLGFL
jgi:hypothetical protein